MNYDEKTPRRKKDNRRSRRFRRSISKVMGRMRRKSISRQRSSRKTHKQKVADTFKKKKSGSKKKKSGPKGTIKKKQGPMRNKLAKKTHAKIVKKRIFDNIVTKFVDQRKRGLDSINPAAAIPNALNFLVQYILYNIRGVMGTLSSPDDKIIVPTGNSLFSKLLMMGADVVKWAGQKTFSSCQIVIIIASKLWVHGVVYKLFAAVDSFFEMLKKYKPVQLGNKVPKLMNKLQTNYGLGPEHFNLLYVNPGQPSPARSEVDESSVTQFIEKMEEFENAFNEVDKVILEMMKTWKKDEGPGVCPIAERPMQRMKETREELWEGARKYTEMVDGGVRKEAAKRLSPPGQINMGLPNAEEAAVAEEEYSEEEEAAAAPRVRGYYDQIGPDERGRWTQDPGGAGAAAAAGAGAAAAAGAGAAAVYDPVEEHERFDREYGRFQ